MEPPNRVVLKYCSAGPRSLWVLTAGQDVFMRLGISETLPQGKLSKDLFGIQGLHYLPLSAINFGDNIFGGINFGEISAIN